MYSNVDQLLNKVEDLKTLISGNEPDIMLLTEIIPKAQRNEIHEAQLNVPGYEKFVNFKFSDQHLGASGKRGVAIYAKEELDTEEIKLNTDYADHLWVEVTLRNKDILLCGCVYRSPSKDKDAENRTTQEICEIISKAALRNNTRLLICGDFNYPDVDWECDYSTNENAKIFLQKLQELHLYQHVCSPTRYREGQVPSLLDLIITTEEGMVTNLEHKPGLGESDHECLEFHLNCYKDKTVSKPLLNYYKSDFGTMRNRLDKINWISELKGNFLDMYQTYLVIMGKVLEGCIPNKSARSKKKNMYLTGDTLKLKDLKAKLWKRYKASQPGLGVPDPLAAGTGDPW